MQKKVFSSSSSYHVVNVFTCLFNQVSLLEMRELIEVTGGLMVLGDSFGQSVFKESLRRIFKQYPEETIDVVQLQMAFNGSIMICAPILTMIYLSMKTFLHRHLI